LNSGQTSRNEIWELSKLGLKINIFLLIKLIDNTTEGKWMNFEQSLGKLKIYEFVKWFSSETGTFNKEELKQLYEYILTSSYSSVILFNIWANEIDISSVSPKSDFATLINSNDHFFSTNYTRTLEEIYSVQNVCHSKAIYGESGV
jgi:hypothetical protein